MTGSWWGSKASKQDVADIQNYILRNARKYGVTPDKVLWTCHKGRAKGQVKEGKKVLVNPVGFVFNKETFEDEDGGVIVTKYPCWLSAKTRATNDYKDRTVMIQCYNRYPLHDVASYLQDYGQPVDPDVFCVSEVVQWFFRGSVRSEIHMVWCCANKRVYDLLVRWFNDEDVKKEKK